MFIKAKRDFFDDMGFVKDGQVIEVDDAKGADLVRLGLASDVQEGGPTGGGGPTSSGQSTAQTGRKASRSSSRADQAQQTSTSVQQEAAPASSASTTVTDSQAGQTSSTPVMVPGGKQKKAPKGSKG